jgi:hypothetical protein
METSKYLRCYLPRVKISTERTRYLDFALVRQIQICMFTSMYTDIDIDMRVCMLLMCVGWKDSISSLGDHWACEARELSGR